MKFLTDDDGFSINPAHITAVRPVKENTGSYKNNKEYPYVVDIHVTNREKPFTVYLNESQKEELARLVQGVGGV